MKGKEKDAYGAVVREARKLLGNTQEQLARALKVSFPTVNRWENGKTQPDERARHALAALIRAKGPEYRELANQIDGGEEPPAIEERPKRGRRLRSAETALPTDSTTLDTKAMEGMLWKAACSIRGEKDAPKFKDYILPLLFLKRLSDVFEDEVARLAETYGDAETALTILEEDHSLVRFFIPETATWPVLAGRKKVEWPAGKAPKTLGERLTNAVRAVARANASLQGVVDVVDFNETRNGEREVSDDALHRIIELFSEPRYRLGLRDVEADFLGRAYEYLLRKFAEGQGQSAGEFFTPKEVGWLIAHLVEPKQGEEVYDYACGSAGLLIKCELRLLQREKNVKRPLKLHGQEYTGSSFAIARMNMVLHDMEGEIVRGDTMTNPKFLDGSRLRRFDIIVANPMWNQDNIDPSIYESDPYERFSSGYAPASNADWAWLQHTIASLKDDGRAAIVLDSGAASRGSDSPGDSVERQIRKSFVDHDWIHAVILLPENLFYNTSGEGLILLVNRAKPPSLRNRIILVNAREAFSKGKPKNFLDGDSIRRITDAVRGGLDIEHFTRVITRDEVVASNYSLSPSRFIDPTATERFDAPQAILEDYRRLTDAQRPTDTEILSRFAEIEQLLAKASESAADRPAGWSLTSLGELQRRGALRIQNGFACGDHALNGVGLPHMRPFNVTTDGRISLTEIKTIQERPALDDYLLEEGDVLYNNTNSEELVGKCAYWPGIAGRFVLSNHMTLLRLEETAEVSARYLSFYLLWFWRSRRARRFSRRHVNQASIGLERLRSIPVLIPPNSDQASISAAFAAVQRGIAEHEQMAARLTSLLASSFDHMFAATLGDISSPAEAQ